MDAITQQCYYCKESAWMSNYRLDNTIDVIKSLSVEHVILQHILMIEIQLFSLRLPSGECHKTSLTIIQHWFKEWLGAVRQQAIAWTNVDHVLLYHKATLSHNASINGMDKYVTTWMSNYTP